MNKKIGWMVGLLALVLLIGGASVLYNLMSEDTAPPPVAAPPTETETTEEETVEPVAAPDFTVFNSQGEPVQLSDFIGTPVILNFWASWCSPCKSEMPDFDEAYAQYGDQIHFVMVNCTDGGRETVDTAKAFIQDAGYSFPVYFDVNFEASYTYGASSIPLTYFIDAEGNLVTYARGALSADMLRQGIGYIYTEE